MEFSRAFSTGVCQREKAEGAKKTHVDTFESLMRNIENDPDLMIVTEGKLDVETCRAGTTIGVFTSGGDSQGMNAAVRAIARTGMYLGCKVFYIKEGYQGMIDGGANFEEATLGSTSNIIHVGGTNIGSARCMEFKDRAGRLRAASNLLKHGINNLIAIGGDGSLTGADMFRQEWPSLLRELLDKELITRDVASRYESINLVGLVGSIDNDFCGTDVTLGSNSALHRILESIDDITTTAVSHKRAFVLEVMGRMCGYLPIVGGLASEASAIFIPENPPEGDWRDFLCNELTEKSKGGEIRRTHIVLVAEGAMDRKHNPISCNDVQKVLSSRMNMDTRVTVLGHVQRGGVTSAFDRILGSRIGVEAVKTLLDATPTTPAFVVGMHFNAIVRIPMMKAVAQTRRVGIMLASGEYDEVIELRGRCGHSELIPCMPFLPDPKLFRSVFSTAGHGASHDTPWGYNVVWITKQEEKKLLRIAMVHVGEPACGMNAVARAFVMISVANGYLPVFIYNSWLGLLDDKVNIMNQNDVHLWTAKGGSMLGTNLQTADDVGLDNVARQLVKHEVSGLIIVGGFEAFKSACQLEETRSTYPEFCIPINVVPVTIANNVPGNEFSLGTDTALNQICKTCDDLKHSAQSLNKCVYVVEVGGNNCGCLATMAGIATGADRTFIREEPFTVRDLQDTCEMLKKKLQHEGVSHGLILRSENANSNLTTDFIFRLLNEEGKPEFLARKSVLGNTQEAITSSPYDRYTGLKIATRSTLWVIKTMEKWGALDGHVHSESPDTVVVSSMQTGKVGFQSIEDLRPQTDFVYSVPKHNWWLALRPLFQIFRGFRYIQKH